MRVLVVQTAYLGDLVLTTPLLRALRDRAGVRQLAVLTTPTGAQVFEGLAGIDRIHVHDKRAGAAALARAAALLGPLRAARYDVAIAAQRSHRSAAFVRGSAARRRIGFAGAPGRWGYTTTVAVEPGRHAIDRYLELARPLGVDPRTCERRPEIAIPQAARASMTLALGGAGDPARPFLALAPGSMRGTKRWLPEGFAEVARWAAGHGLRPVLVGDRRDVELCRAIAADAGAPAISLAGATDVKQLAALLAGARALVANDSGAGHVAAAVGTPVVSIFGPTTAALGFAPYGPANRLVERAALACRPCHRHGPERCPLGHFRCMREIRAGDVIRRLEPLLALPQTRRTAN